MQCYWIKFWKYRGPNNKNVNVLYKACGPSMVALLNWIHNFEWYLAKLIVRNHEHQKDTCYDEIYSVLKL